MLMPDMVTGTAIVVRDIVGDAGAVARADAFVRARADGTPFHLSAWNTAVCGACGQVPHLLAAYRGAALAGILPLTEVHSPLFGRALAGSGFAVSGGILADDDRAAQALADAAVRLGVATSCPSVELRGGWLPAGWHRDDGSYVGFTRPIAADDEAELLAIPRKQRAEVRRALGNDLTVTIGRDAQARAEHHAVYAASVHNLGTPVFPKALFAEVLERFGDDADILTVHHDGRAVASVLSLYHAGTVMPYWGGGTAAARVLRANDLMYYALMGHARARGCTTFDFGRSKVGTGAAAFKRNWGFEGRPLSYAVHGDAPRQINPLDPKYCAKIAAWKRLPLPLATLIGPWIARGLG